MKKISFSYFTAVSLTLLIVLNLSCSKVDQIPPVDFYIDLNDPAYSSLQITGNFIYINGLIVLKGLDQNYYALSQYCTYDGCNVEYQVGFDELSCLCEGSKFDKYGNVMMGPATYPLYQYITSLTGNGILRIYTTP